VGAKVGVSAIFATLLRVAKCYVEDDWLEVRSDTLMPLDMGRPLIQSPVSYLRSTWYLWYPTRRPRSQTRKLTSARLICTWNTLYVGPNPESHRHGMLAVGQHCSAMARRIYFWFYTASNTLIRAYQIPRIHVIVSYFPMHVL
jgi:hypothetical protein